MVAVYDNVVCSDNRHRHEYAVVVIPLPGILDMPKETIPAHPVLRCDQLL
jgi:hypothetical protein